MCLTFLVVYQLLVCFGSGEREKESGSDLRVALSTAIPRNEQAQKRSSEKTTRPPDKTGS